MSQHSSSGRKWNDIREAVLQRDGYSCVICNQSANHVDHIVPKSRGGTDDEDNLQTMCATHNLKKGNKMVTRGTYWNTTAFPDGLPTITQ